MLTENDIDERLAWLAVALAFVGGFVDAVGFVALAHVFTGHVTGNTVLFAIDVAEGTWTRGLHRMLAIVMFFVGMMLGAILNEEVLRRGIRFRFAVAFVLEAILLAGLLFGNQSRAGTATPVRPFWELYTLVALAATALGVQNGTLRRVSGATVHTTYTTGMLTAWSEGMFQWWFWWRAGKQHKPRRQADPEADVGARPPGAGRLVLLLGVIVTFGVGAGIGVYLYLGYGLWSLVVPVLMLLVMATIDVKHPFSSRPAQRM